MTKESERKKIVEAIVSEGEIREHLKAAGFEFKVGKDDTFEFQVNGTKVAEEGKTKKKANL